MPAVNARAASARLAKALKVLARSLTISVPSAFLSSARERSNFRKSQSTHRPATNPKSNNAVTRSQVCSERSSRNFQDHLSGLSWLFLDEVGSNGTRMGMRVAVNM